MPAATWQDAVYRELATGVPLADTEGGGDEYGQSGIPDGPITTILPNQTGVPWVEGLEAPESAPSLPWTADPQYEDFTTGAMPAPGAYEGSFRTSGPVVGFGHEVSGGPYGDQALGRRQKFSPYIPERYDRNGVQMPSYADELAAALAYNGQGQVSESEYTTDLLGSL